MAGSSPKFIFTTSQNKATKTKPIEMCVKAFAIVLCRALSYKLSLLVRKAKTAAVT